MSRSIPGFHTPAVGFEDPQAMLSACHERVQRSLDLLARLIDHVDVQGHDSASRSAASDVLRYFTLAAPLHHQDEEKHLFPLLLAQGSAEQALAVRRLQQDHCDMESLWQTFSPLLREWADGQALPLVQAQRDAVTRFCALYPPHIELEETLVFPAAFALLDERGQTAAGAEMQARRRVGHNPGA